MIELVIKLEKLSDIRDFVKLATQCPGDVVVHSQRWIVSGKSIMGMYSLEFSDELKVEIHGDIPAEVREGMKKFIAN